MTTNELTIHFPYETIRSLADSNQCSNLSEESIRFLTFQTTGIVQFLLQDALKFTRKCRRTHMLVEDFESALKSRYLDPYFPSHLSLNSNQNEISLDQLTKLPLPKAPLDVSLRAHWLAIEGKQPTISENPDETAMVDSTKLLTKNRYNTDAAKIKTSNPHELSLEQQIFYKEITEACIGSDDHKRQEAIQSLTNETGLHQILPRLVLFICEGVKVNIQQTNLIHLKSLMQMINGLLENKSLYCEKYLHQLFPAVMSCILSKQVCTRPDVENHWDLRDYAAKRCALMIKMFATNVHGLRNRIVRIYLQTFYDERLSLVTYYGALIGLCEMGQETIEQLVFPIIKVLGERMMKLNESSTLSSSDKNTIQRINQIVFKYIPNAYRTSHSEPDNLEYFKQEFSHYYGQRLYESIIQLYQRQPTQVSNRVTHD